MNADGKNTRKITDGGELAVSPDGRFVVFQSRENDSFGLWRTDTKDGSSKRLTTGVDFTPDFSPDGKWIYFSRFQDQTNLWRVPFEGGEAQLVTNEFRTTSSPAVSPDGKTLALAYGRIIKKEDSPSGLALISLENNQILKTFDVPEFRFGSFYEQPTLQWTPDGKAVNFIILQDGVSNIWQQPLTGGNRVQVTHFKDGRIFNFAFSPDGQQIALSRGTVTSDVVLIENLR
jgi:TolB protein